MPRFTAAIALLSILAVSFPSVSAQDFTWDIKPVEDYSVVGFNSESSNSEVEFKYILTFVVSQPNITETVTKPPTAKHCSGICNDQTQLPSKFFTEPSPADVQVEGVAVLTFGVPGRHQLATVPIQQPLRKTQEENNPLQDAAVDDGASGPNRDFDPHGGHGKQQASVETSDSINGWVLATVALIVLVVVAIGALIVVEIDTYCWCCFGAAAKKRRRKHHEDYEEDFTASTESSTIKQEHQGIGSRAARQSQNSQATDASFTV